MTDKIEITVGNAYRVKGQLATATAIKSGWITFETDGGDVFKARAKDVDQDLGPAGAVSDDPRTIPGRKFIAYDEEGHAKVALFRTERYARHKNFSTEGGNVPYDIGDSVAEKLRGLSLEEQYKVCAELLRAVGEASASRAAVIRELEERYGHLNPGQVRMNLGNRMRGALKRAARAEEEAEDAA